jgi:Kelch motif
MSSHRLQVVIALLVALVLAGCQAASPSPEASPSPSATSVPSQTGAPTPSVEPTPPATPVTTHWEQLASMTTARDGLRAVAFADGRVLVTGNDQGAELWDPANGTWHSAGWFDKPRTNYALVELQDGRAMVIGGMNAIDQSYVSALVFDPRTPDAGWVRIQDLMDIGRTDPSAVVLADGRVLVAGGYFRVAPEWGSLPSRGIALASAHGPLADVMPPNVGAAMATAVLFDPATETWSDTGPMTYARYGASATLLADGRVLVVGSFCDPYGAVTVDWTACSSAEIYDPATGRFSLTGSLPALDWSSIDIPIAPGVRPEFRPSLGALLAVPDGGAVLVNAYASLRMTGQAIGSYRYDADAGTWRQIGDAYVSLWDYETDEEVETEDVLPRLAPMVTGLPDGRVVIAGGDGMGWSPSTTATVELYDPATDRWLDLPPMPEARAEAAAVTMPDGSAFIAGGHRGTMNGPRSALATVVRLVIGED